MRPNLLDETELTYEDFQAVGKDWANLHRFWSNDQRRLLIHHRLGQNEDETFSLYEVAYTHDEPEEERTYFVKLTKRLVVHASELAEYGDELPFVDYYHLAELSEDFALEYLMARAREQGESGESAAATLQDELGVAPPPVTKEPGIPPHYGAFLKASKKWAYICHPYSRFERHREEQETRLYAGEASDGSLDLYTVTLHWESCRKKRLADMEITRKRIQTVREFVLLVDDHERTYDQLYDISRDVAKSFLLVLMEGKGDNACAWARAKIHLDYDYGPNALQSENHRSKVEAVMTRLKKRADTPYFIDLQNSSLVALNSNVRYLPCFFDKSEPMDGDALQDSLAKAWQNASEAEAAAPPPEEAKKIQPTDPMDELVKNVCEQLDLSQMILVQNTYDSLPDFRKRALCQDFFDAYMRDTMPLKAIYLKHGMEDRDIRELFTLFIQEKLAIEINWSNPPQVRMDNERRLKNEMDWQKRAAKATAQKRSV